MTSTASSTARLSRRQRIALGVIVATALALRLAVIFEQRSDVLFDHPGLDEQHYVDLARDLAAGRPGDPIAYWQPPGILYVLGATFELAGPGLLLPRILQALVSAASCLLLFAVARRLFRPSVALAAAAILAVHGVLVFESHELLPPTWILFLDLLVLHLLLWTGARGPAPRAFLAGLALGASAVFAPTILPFFLVAALWLRRPAAIGALALGVVMPIAPVTARNWQRGHEVVMVSTNAGLNFHIGNNQRYRDTFSLRPGRRWEELVQEPKAHGIAPGTGAASSYFMSKGLWFWRHHPGQAAALAVRKLYLFFHGAEIPRDTDLYAARAQSRVLRVLVGPRGMWWPNGLLIPLALVGAAMLWRERARLLLPYGFLAAQAAVIPAFFVTSRHRTPALAAFALFAAAGVALVVERWRHWRAPQRATAAVGAVLLVALFNLPTWEGRLSYAGELDFRRGLALRDLHRPAQAITALRRAAAADPADARFSFELGNALDATGLSRDAVDAWLRAAASDPWDSRPRRRVAAVLTRLGDVDGAVAALQANIDAAQRDPAHYAPDHLNLAALRARRGELPRAVDHLRAAAAADRAFTGGKLPGLTRALLESGQIQDAGFFMAVGDVNRDAGSPEAAAAAWQRARELEAAGPTGQDPP